MEASLNRPRVQMYGTVAKSAMRLTDAAEPVGQR